MKCKRCGLDFHSLEEHHIHPKYMDNPHGFAPKNFVSRVNLCFNCHQKILHKKIIIPTLKEFSTKPKYNAEHLLWKNIKPLNKKIAKEKVVMKTKRWLNNGF